MLVLSTPPTLKVGGTVECEINGTPRKVTCWLDTWTLHNSGTMNCGTSSYRSAAIRETGEPSTLLLHHRTPIKQRGEGID